MIITRLMGGLGNQMFQYAAGRALALRCGCELKLDLSWFGRTFANTARREFMLGAFPIAASATTEEEAKSLVYARRSILDWLSRRPLRHAETYIVEREFSYWTGIEGIEPPAYINGYWQNELYFSHAAKEIRRDFSFPPLPEGGAGEIARRISEAPHPVALHVRRGDYAGNKVTFEYHGLCPPEYYKAALAEIAGRISGPPELFIFSDEPAWVRENFDSSGFPFVVMDFPGHVAAPWHDMHLMSLCRHHIIANSSFSWWGAWLSSLEGIKCAPKNWFAAEEKKGFTPVPDLWIRL